MDSMIRIEKLRKSFGNFLAVDNVSFQVSKGEVLGFLGPNGAGKSTTMKMVCGFLPPTSGSAVVCGHDILKAPLKAKKTIGYLPEGAPAYPDMTPDSFLRFVAQIRGYSGKELAKRVDRSVELTSLESHLHVPIENLSKGFKRRVGLAQAILHDPPVLVMDEPTDGLDPNQKFEVRKLIKEMSGEKAIILSTHILEEVEAVCTRAIIIAAGKVIADGSPSTLQAKSSNHNAVFLRVRKEGANGVKAKLAEQTWVKSVEECEAIEGSHAYRIFPKEGKTILQKTSEIAHRENWTIDMLREEHGKLDEVFRDLTAETTIKAGREN